MIFMVIDKGWATINPNCNINDCDQLLAVINCNNNCCSEVKFNGDIISKEKLGTVSRDLTIDGGQYSLTGNDAEGIVVDAPVSLIVKNVVFKNFKSTYKVGS